MQKTHTEMSKSTKFTNVQTAKDILNAKESWKSRYQALKLDVKIGFNSGCGVVHVRDISNIISITELSACLRRADIGTYVLFYITKADDEVIDNKSDWVCTVWAKKASDTWHINPIL